MEQIILVGYGGHAKSVIDSIERGHRYEIVGYTDLDDAKDNRYPYLGKDAVLQEYYDRGVRNAFVTVGCVGESGLRKTLYTTLKEIGYRLPTIVDPSAILAGNAMIGEGTFVGKKSIINDSSVIGTMCIVNTGAIIEHDCIVADHSHVAVGAILCGAVHVGEGTMVGAGATVIQTVKIGEKCIIGAGAVVTKDIAAHTKVVGVPAKSIAE